MIKALQGLSKQELYNIEKQNVCKHTYTELNDFALLFNEGVIKDTQFSDYLDRNNISGFELLIIIELQNIDDSKLADYKNKIKALNQRARRLIPQKKTGWFK